VRVLRNGNIEITTQLLPEMYALLMKVTEETEGNVSEVINAGLGIACPMFLAHAVELRANVTKYREESAKSEEN
jgi:hypothetical protein